MNRSYLALALVLVPLNACVPPAATAGADAEAGATVAPPPEGGVALANRPDALRMMNLHYDELLRDAGVTGTVDTELTLNADGTVREHRVLDSTHNRFTASARQVAPRLRFTLPPVPGTRVRVRMRFIYDRNEIDVVGVVAGAPPAP